MNNSDDFLILGFTGPFCSGCSTAANFFENEINHAKKKWVVKKDEIDSKVAEFYRELSKGNKDSEVLSKRKDLIKLLRERQIINALNKIADHDFYYISMTDMMNLVLIKRFLNSDKNTDNTDSKYSKLIAFLEKWCQKNDLGKERINQLEKVILDRDLSRDDEVKCFLNKIKSFRDEIHSYFENSQDELFPLMQAIGNNLRKNNDPFDDDETFSSPQHLSVLSKEATAILKYHRKCKKKDPSRDNRTYYIIECLRNPSEVEYLRKRFYEFYLFSIYSEEKERVKRAEKKYRLSHEECMGIDKIDQGGNYIKALYMQNVKQCVNIADISVTNNSLTHDFHRTLLKYFALIKMPGCIKPTHSERNMHLAYSMSLNSTCISRQVGAVIVKKGDVIGSGWNDTDRNRQGCSYRLRSDIDRTDNSTFPICPDSDYDHFSNIILNDPKKIDHSFCYKDEYGEFKKAKDKKKHKIPDECNEIIQGIGTKSLQQCRALHAEENAILQTSAIGGVGLSNSTLYTTTFPCELCAKKIRRVEIKRIVYCEPYPKSVSMDVFFKEGFRKIKTIPFQGVKSPSYYRLFKSSFDIKERQYLELMSGS